MSDTPIWDQTVTNLNYPWAVWQQATEQQKRWEQRNNAAIRYAVIHGSEHIIRSEN